MDVHVCETEVCHYTHIYLSFRILQIQIISQSTEQFNIYIYYNIRITHKEVLVLSPTIVNINGKLYSVLTNNLNQKDPTSQNTCVREDTVLFHTSPSLVLNILTFCLNSVETNIFFKFFLLSQVDLLCTRIIYLIRADFYHPDTHPTHNLGIKTHFCLRVRKHGVISM